MKIKQGYPEEVIGELDNTKSGWFFYVDKDCKMIHEKTLRKMVDTINELKDDEK